MSERVRWQRSSAESMKHHLGNFNQPVLLFGGPYGNLQATRALKAIAAEASIPPDRIICTGDVTAYCAQAKETVSLIRDWGIHCIQGNVEAQLATGAADCGCNFLRDSSCDLLSQQWYRFTQQEITADQRRWFRDLPKHLQFDLNGFSCVVVHGAFTEMSRFVFQSTPWSEKQSELERADASVLIGGHSGLPFSQIENGRLWCNAGVIGMPANDGTPRAWYAILEPDGATIKCSHFSFHYDHQTAADLMDQNSLPSEYRDALISGLWHSCDILPEAETQAQGLELAESQVVLFAESHDAN